MLKTKATYVIFFALRISPWPIAAPTRAEIANPMHIGITNMHCIKLKEITIVAWFDSPKKPLIIYNP